MKPNVITSKPKKITVWIPGTRGKELFPTYLSQNVREIEKRICFAPPGLHLAKEIDTHYYVHTIAQLIVTSDPLAFPLDNFYIFGWSGKLDPNARQEEGVALYNALEHLQHVFKDNVLEITIITHSHGGNVALNMALAYNKSKHNIEIKKLILLACPVQETTKQFTHSSLFKHVYSIHSHADILQRLDPQITHPLVFAWKESIRLRTLTPFKKLFTHSWYKKNKKLFSERHFAASPKIKQATIEWKTIKPWSKEDINVFAPYSEQVAFIAHLFKDQRALGHLEFMMPTFLKKLPMIITQLDHSKTKPDDIHISL